MSERTDHDFFRTLSRGLCGNAALKVGFTDEHAFSAFACLKDGGADRKDKVTL
jgi:hypothetical protein